MLFNKCNVWKNLYYENGSKSTKVYNWTKNFDDALSVLYNKPCASVIDL